MKYKTIYLYPINQISTFKEFYSCPKTVQAAYNT